MGVGRWHVSKPLTASLTLFFRDSIPCRDDEIAKHLTTKHDSSIISKKYKIGDLITFSVVENSHHEPIIRTAVLDARVQKYKEAITRDLRNVADDQGMDVLSDSSTHGLLIVPEPSALVLLPLDLDI